jgi:hypothetical protein
MGRCRFIAVLLLASFALAACAENRKLLADGEQRLFEVVHACSCMLRYECWPIQTACRRVNLLFPPVCAVPSRMR